MNFEEKCEKLLNMYRLDEVKLSRVWEYVTDPGRIFGIVSSFRAGNSLDENMKLYSELEEDIKMLGRGYVKAEGGYVEENDTVKNTVSELSFIITDKLPEDIEAREAEMKKFKKEMIMLGVKYDQDTVMYKDPDGFHYIAAVARNGHMSGDVVSTFSTDGHDAMTMAKELIEKFYSQLTYGPHHGRKFLFSMK